MFRQVTSIFSFLTIIPAGHYNLETVAKYMYFFPIVGLVIGIMVGGIGWGLSLFLEPLIVSLLVITTLILITGLHHIDGLSDFADGLMVKGTKERKLEVMKDPTIGSAGIITIVLYVVSAIIGLSMIKGFELFYVILISEIIAKFSMVLAASIGPSAWSGSNSPFIHSMKNKKRLGISAAITVSLIAVFQNNVGFVLLAFSVMITLSVIGISRKSFGGISGDVIGAINEISRISSFLVFVSI